MYWKILILATVLVVFPRFLFNTAMILGAWWASWGKDTSAEFLRGAKVYFYAGRFFHVISGALNMIKFTPFARMCEVEAVKFYQHSAQCKAISDQHSEEQMSDSQFFETFDELGGQYHET